VPDCLDSEQMFKELQEEADHFGGHATPVKLFITNRNIPSGQSDGFTTLIKFDPETEQAAEHLEQIVSTLYEENDRGLWKWSYRVYPQYSCCFVDMDPIIIKFPNQGESGNTVFDVYKDVVPDATKRKVARAIARKFGVRCSLVGGKSNGFLIERLPGGEYLYQLASSCGCTVKQVLRKIRAGGAISTPTPDMLAAYMPRFYFFVQYEVDEGTSKIVHIGYRKVGDVGHGVENDTADDARLYEEPTAVAIAPGIVEVRFRPASDQFEKTVTINECGEPAMNLAILTSMCQYAVRSMEKAIARDFKVAIGFGGYTDADTGRRGLRIIGTNLDTAAIKELKIDFVYEFEKPVKREVAPPGKKTMSVEEVGGSIGFGLALGQKEGPVEPGESRAYLLPVFAMDHVRELVDSLPSERYRVDMTVGGKTEVAITGKVIGEFIRRELADRPTTTTTPPPSPTETTTVENQEGHSA
jgi:hypothetical protein